MRRMTGSAWSVLVVLCAAGVAAPPVFARSVAYDQKTIMNDEVTMAKVIMQDENFWMETVQEGIDTVAIQNAKGIFTYLPGKRIAMKLPELKTSQGGTIKDLHDYVGYVNQHNGKVIGQETIEGKACDIYQFVDPANGNATTAWIWKEREFPLRLETDGPEGKIITEFQNVQFDVPVNPSLFEIPAGYEMADADDALGGLGQMLQGLDADSGADLGNDLKRKLKLH